MFDIPFIEQVLFDLAPAGRIEDFFLDHGMGAELAADLLNQRLLFASARGVFELGKQLLHLAMIGLQQGNGVQMVLALHDGSLEQRWFDCHAV